jgi:hypothetical protein
MPESPPTHVNPQPTEPQTNPPPAAPQDIPPAIVPARREVQEKRLVGNWAKEAVRKSDPTLRWEIMDDGRYSITSGETTIDTGTLTAAKGILSQTSETSGQTVAGMYQLRTATQIYTKGLPYSGTWKKVRTASVEPPHEPDKNIPSGDDKPSANNNSQTSNKKPNNGFSSAPKRDGTSVERKARDIGNSLRRRFGF